MAKKALSIVETGWRATLEEQDDTIVWLTHAMKGAGADLTVLLRGNAVGYAVKAQDASGLAFGEKKQTQPPQIAEDVAKLVGKGVGVYVVEDDAAERGIERTDLVEGLQFVKRAGIPAMLAGYDLVWHW
jgi:intracellular sulfur oxidation DsrE/DsrF family protein